jgi:hypothetical protein
MSFVCNPDIQFNLHKSLPLSEVNLVQKATPYFFKVKLNINFPYMSRSSKWARPVIYV